MAEAQDFKSKQYAFAAHIRDPENVAAPQGIEDRRMAIYRELFFNNLSSLLSGMFPVIYKIHNRERWDHMIRQFMVVHKAETPYFLQIPKEFLAFLQDGYVADNDDFPFLAELAHYEWVELELSVSDAEDNLSGVDAAGDLLNGVPVISSVAAVYAYQFPVHRIAEDYLPLEVPEQPTYIAVYRKTNDEIEFMELNPVAARLMQMIQENSAGKSGRELLAMLASEINFDPDGLVEHGLAAMQQMLEAEILKGAKTASA